VKISLKAVALAGRLAGTAAEEKGDLTMTCWRLNAGAASCLIINQVYIQSLAPDVRG
jgi:hypothetical protein